jgi:hypothetical protein
VLHGKENTEDEGKNSSETFVNIYPITRNHITEDSNLQLILCYSNKNPFIVYDNWALFQAIHNNEYLCDISWY